MQHGGVWRRLALSSRKDFQLHAVESLWRRGAYIPLYALPSGAPGHGKFYWDLRYILAQSRTFGGYQFFKQENYRGIPDRIVQHFGLSGQDRLPSNDGASHSPRITSTCSTFCWLTFRWILAIGTRNRLAPAYTSGWAELMQGAGTAAAEVVQMDVQGR